MYGQQTGLCYMSRCGVPVLCALQHLVVCSRHHAHKPELLLLLSTCACAAAVCWCVMRAVCWVLLLRCLTSLGGRA